MSELDYLLNSFELQTENHNGDISHGWLYYGDVNPKDAQEELSVLRADLAAALSTLRVIKADRPSAHSDRVWQMLNETISRLEHKNDCG